MAFWNKDKSAPVGPQVVKEDPTAHIAVGYTKDRPAPYDVKRMLAELGCHPLAVACITKIANEASQATFTAYDAKGNVDEKITALLAAPNPDMSGNDVRKLAYMGLAGLGNAHIIGYRGSRKNIAELWPTRTDRMTAHLTERGALDSWVYEYSGKKAKMPAADVLHIKRHWITLEQFGQAPAVPMAASLKYLDGYHDHNNRLLDGAQGVSEILALGNKDDALSAEQVKEVMAGLNAFRLGAANHGSRLFLNANVKSVSSGVGPSDMHVGGWVDHLVNDICTGFGVPSVLLGIGGGVTYENQKEARASFWEDTLIPGYITPLAEGLSRFFGVTVKANLDEVPALVNRRMERLKSIDGLTCLTADEKRELMGYGPVSGGGELYIEANKVPLGFDTGEVDFSQFDPAIGSEGAVAATDAKSEQVTLNGAQVTGLLSIIDNVVASGLPEASAVALIQLAFPSVDDEQILSLLKPLRGFSPPKADTEE